MNDALRRLEPLVGEWDVTLTHAWFLDSLDTEIHGTATIEWYADAFLLLRSSLPGPHGRPGWLGVGHGVQPERPAGHLPRPLQR